MLQLSNLLKLKRKRKRVGRGGSLGGTSGKGHKGQKARSGSGSELRPYFEGGQMPLSRRLPARGFTNSFKKDIRVVNLKDLQSKFAEGDTVNRETLIKSGLIKGGGKYFIKILGNGELTKKLDIQVDAISKSAAKVIKESGGKFQLIEESGSGITS